MICTSDSKYKHELDMNKWEVDDAIKTKHLE